MIFCDKNKMVIQNNYGIDIHNIYKNIYIYLNENKKSYNNYTY